MILRVHADRLLVIDDNPDHWAIIQVVLNRYLPNLKLVWMSEPQAAIEYLTDCGTRQTHPTLILLDLYLPERKMGLSLLQQIKALPATAHCPTPIVALSYSNASQAVEAMYQAGCASYLVKPLTLDGWHELVQKLKVHWWDTVTRPQAGYSL